ncbi:urea transporter [Chitinophaga dinghuensis]|uniref:Urea transporter n=1 Tax=Chitinophaga dinghuensis TaxID=1539050 RepID=A0A327VWA2_9BACT|nr:urea transporter [Chitinophaga dinghuensis]RAJ80281.1 urea transporter [Chitinophaga dinghuensis]
MQEQKLLPVARIFRGVGQIMLQANAWTGVLFLVGIFYDSYVMGIGALLAVCIGTLTAKLLHYPEEEINQGLYGFSATLVGVALTFYFEPVPVIWVALIVGSALAAIIQHAMIRRKLPGFTFPFIIITWILLYVFKHLYVVGPSPEVSSVAQAYDDFTVSTHGFGEVIFQGSVLAGIIFFLGVFVGSPIAALYGAAASVLGAYISTQFREPAQEIHMGLFSFNAVLCAIAFAGPKRSDGIWVLISVFLAVFIDFGMLEFNLAVLTFPFVLASWITLGLKAGVTKISKKNE